MVPAALDGGGRRYRRITRERHGGLEWADHAEGVQDSGTCYAGVAMATSAPDGVPVVLIADDDADIRAVLSMALEDEGYGMIEAADGQDALALALARTVDLIVLDLHMPQLDGQAFCEAYREGGGRAPVLLMTAANIEDTVAATATCNAAGYIRKPFDLEDVLDTIERLVARP